MERSRPTPGPSQSRMPSEGEARGLAQQLRYVEARTGNTRTEARPNGREGRSDARGMENRRRPIVTPRLSSAIASGVERPNYGAQPCSVACPPNERPEIRAASCGVSPKGGRPGPSREKPDARKSKARVNGQSAANLSAREDSESSSNAAANVSPPHSHDAALVHQHCVRIG
jgi:hypothetical protein